MAQQVDICTNQLIFSDKCNDEFPLTTCIPWPLPKHYQDSVKQKELIITKYKSAVKDAKMTRYSLKYTFE